MQHKHALLLRALDGMSPIVALVCQMSSFVESSGLGLVAEKV